MALPQFPRKTIFFALIALAVTLEVAADILLKKWSLEERNTLLIAGLALYFIGTIFWAFSLREELLSKAVTIFTVLNMIVVILAGLIVFKESLSLQNKVGIVLGILSILLLEL